MDKLQELTLQELLEKEEIKQRKISKLLILYESAVSSKISGKREISLEEVRVFAEILKTTSDQIHYALDFAKCKEEY